MNVSTFMKFHSARISVSILPLSFFSFPVFSHQVQWISYPKYHCTSICFFLFILPAFQSKQWHFTGRWNSLLYGLPEATLRPYHVALLLETVQQSPFAFQKKSSTIHAIYNTLNDTCTTLFISSHMPSVFDCVISSAAKATTSLSFTHQSLDIFLSLN